jgi:hypothetical protein
VQFLIISIPDNAFAREERKVAVFVPYTSTASARTAITTKVAYVSYRSKGLGRSWPEASVAFGRLFDLIQDRLMLPMNRCLVAS